MAPFYWLLVPARYRREVLAVASLIGLGIYDVRLPMLLLGLNLFLFAAARVSAAGGARRSHAPAAIGLLALAALFVWNKLAGGEGGVLPSQGGLVLVGVSYLVLKAAAALIETARGSVREVGFRDLLAWSVFLPTYPSGPIEELDHFRAQQPSPDRARVLSGLERILFGLVKALILSHYLGAWASPILAAPEGHDWAARLLAMYAFTLRFYFDFAGYSDIAIGLSALFGYEIQENFDNPLIRRNLVQLWQRWHMTLTRWLRLYLFIPVSRSIMRRGGPRWDTTALVAAQVTTMTFCGLWHGLGWNFALWGLLQALGLVWVGVFARPAGRYLPSGLVAWWRRSPVAYALSTLLTFHAFALSNVLVFSDIPQALRYFASLTGG
jgi:alginate O-acetyltransferase complex protein AlgI